VALAGITLPALLTSIGTYAFGNCTALTEITLPTSLGSIGQYAFEYTGLTTLTLPSTVKTINNYAFRGCTDLLWVKWPESSVDAVLGTTTAGQAFSGCTKLEKVELPNNLKTIYNSSFQNCTSLEVVILRRSASPLTVLNSTTAFPSANTDLKIYVPNDQLSDYQAAATWSNAAYNGKIVSDNTLTSGDEPSNW
jgi:hypothetical protein